MLTKKVDCIHYHDVDKNIYNVTLSAGAGSENGGRNATVLARGNLKLTFEHRYNATTQSSKPS